MSDARADSSFAASTVLLAGLAARALGWRPHEVWAATPAELAALQTGWRGDDDGGGGGIDGAALAAMMEQYPDG